MTSAPVASERVAGLLGLVGGLVLLAAFLPGLSLGREANTVRLVLYFAGAIAVALAVHRRQETLARRLSLAATVALVLANAAILGWVIVGIGRPQPPEPDPVYRSLGFLAGAAAWCANAAFGLVAWRLRAVNRWGALALAVGSILAFLGMDRLELVRSDLGWLIQPVALAGIALNGLGWILLGTDLALPRRTRSATPPPHGSPMR